VSLVLLLWTGRPAFAQTAPTAPVAQTGAPVEPLATHEQVHQALDRLYGPGTSERLHQALGPEAETLIDRFVAMQGMLMRLQGMLGQPAMAAMPADHRAMMQGVIEMLQNLSRMTLHMMGMMGSGMPMPAGVMGDHHSMMQSMLAMMQQVTGLVEMMERMEGGMGPGPVPAPAQVPGR
jgi:hypothetical protein